MPNRNGLTDFVGETSDMPTPPASTPGSRNVSGNSASHTSPFQAAGLGASAPDPSVWSEEQQQQFMNALLGAAASGRFPGAGAGALPEQPRPRASSTASSTTAVASSIAGASAPPPTDDPMAALMNALQQGGAGAPPGFQFPGAGISPAETTLPKPKTLLQKLMPVIHIISAWALLAYFALWKEPEAFDAKTHGSRESLWRRWAELGWKSPEDGWGVQAVVSHFFSSRALCIRRLHDIILSLRSHSSGRSPPSRSSSTHGAYSRDLYVSCIAHRWMVS